MLTRKETLSSRTPLIFKNILDWKLLKWSAEEWKNNLGESNKCPFREGHYRCSTEPLWETNCETKVMTIGEFFDEFNAPHKSENNWLYFDYKYISEWFSDNLKDITWDCVGFPERCGSDSTLWIGTEGAHTPCHMDTYGCNMVGQVHGRKLWLLFDSSQTNNLAPTRVPYEESSVYSSINFSCTCHSFPDIKEVRYAILEPGDVLYVPNHWWHYVENLTSAISINTWIPIESDDESRLDESLVKCFISSIVQKLDAAEANYILNPNERDLIETKTRQNIHEINWCAQRLKNIHTRSQTDEVTIDPSSDFALPVHSLHYIIKNIKNRCKFPNEIKSVDNQEITYKNVINAFCHPDNIARVRQSLYNATNSHKQCS